MADAFVRLTFKWIALPFSEISVSSDVDDTLHLSRYVFEFGGLQFLKIVDIFGKIRKREQNVISKKGIYQVLNLCSVHI